MTRRLCRSIALALGAVLFAGCRSNLTSVAPPVTTTFLSAGAHQPGDPRTLSEGRALFLNRCIQCHALPEVARFNAARLTAIVATMSGRANLNHGQHDAVLKYLLAVRANDARTHSN
jgi:mono/diheme cytochrome c family protein